MASLSMARSLAGSKAFTGVRPRRVNVVSNGSKYFMRRKDSFMVEVQVGEEEPEDIAVRRFMKSVVQSRVVEKLRSRKVRETKIEAYKRRFRERVEARKMGLVEPTWEEAYGEDNDPKPFDDFFSPENEDDYFNGVNIGDDEFFRNEYNAEGTTGMWGGYMDQRGTQQGGYMQQQQQQQGGYMNPPAGGGYMTNQAGGYMP